MRPARRPPARAATTLAAVLLACAVGIVSTACTVGPSERPPVAVRGDGVAGPLAPAVPVPAPGTPNLPVPDPQRPLAEFVDCTDEVLAVATVPVPADRTLRADCTELTVPSDPEQPQLGRTRVGLVRIGLADAPEDRPPLLVIGDSAADPSAGHAVTVAAQVPLPVLQAFTLVGLDRRGVGSDALDCASADARAALVDADATDEAALAELLEQARQVVQDCHVLLSGGASGFRTASTASDIAEVRAALGVQRLSAVGVGDGATALARWAAGDPAAVGRLVLDGPPDPTLDEPARSEARAKAAEATFDAFALACTSAPECPLGADPRATVTALVERLRLQELRAPDLRVLTAGGTLTAVLAGLTEPRTWPTLAAALAAADAGDPVPLLDLLDPVAGLGGRFDATIATACNDAARRLSPGEIATLAEGWAHDYPMFGTTLALRLLACGPWPTVADPPPAPVGPLPPVLVLGTAHDPRGPAEGSRRVAELLPSGRFLSWQGSGTGAWPRTPCVDDAVGRLLVDGVAPEGGLEHSLLCPP
ncbi:MAG: alpha/beta fold hydrolase [Pseudonocardia sp.]